MTKTTFYTDHWQHIENERVNRYEQMFAWRDGHAALISSLNLHTGSRVLDYGCGPGFVSLGIANIVSPTGRVYGVDLNKQFVRAASERAETIATVEYR
ncbi:MAG: methyltransferase domain-containing protein [Pseudomonadales bacterium]|nr:methyltransferase domain-containing protein [Pseudomonadales bacterium]